jgi:hypothetical protein
VLVCQEVAVQSVATDSRGVTKVELWIDGSIYRIDASPSPQGQPSFSVTQKWPASVAGNHTLAVKAYNVDNVTSDFVGIAIVVSLTPPATPTNPPVTILPTLTLTPTSPPPTATAFIDFRADSYFLIAGQCTTLRWNILNVKALYLDGIGVAAQGQKQTCPIATTTYTLHVIKNDDTAEDRLLTITVTPAPITPSVTPTATPPTPTLTATPPTLTPTPTPPTPTLPSTKPDLVVTSLVYSPSRVRPNTPVTIKAIITNRGEAASGQFKWRIDNGAGGSATAVVTNLEPRMSVDVTYDTAYSEAEVYLIKTCVDIENQVVESDEENNCSVPLPINVSNY